MRYPIAIAPEGPKFTQAPPIMEEDPTDAIGIDTSKDHDPFEDGGSEDIDRLIGE